MGSKVPLNNGVMFWSYSSVEW